jgi:predicted RNase H-like nuclease
VIVGGVDGCRTGWVLVTADTGAATVLTVEVIEHVNSILDRVRVGDLSAVAVDMPIGLAHRGPRTCDTEARARLGPRRSSVFPTPPRPLLHAVSHVDAVARGRALDGRGISIQAFNLLPRIAELDAAIDPSLCDRVVEAHPESGFATLAGTPLTTKKRSAPGRRERRALLDGVFPGGTDALDARARGAASDDVLDAAVNAWTASRWVQGTAIVLGDGEVDERGLPMRIVV